jgi:hypothetical protein
MKYWKIIADRRRAYRCAVVLRKDALCLSLFHGWELSPQNTEDIGGCTAKYRRYFNSDGEGSVAHQPHGQRVHV